MRNLSTENYDSLRDCCSYTFFRFARIENCIIIFNENKRIQKVRIPTVEKTF